MRIRCPQCRSLLNVIDATVANDEASCPSCGSRFPIADLTVSYRSTITDRVSHFDLLDKAGEGQFGSVWRARDTRLNRIVAVKIPRSNELDEAGKAFFLREARAAAALDHPHIVHVYEAGEDRDAVYIASQFIDGVTLRERMTAHSYSLQEAAQLLATVCEAVHHAHEAGVIHRDLKPSNILVDAHGEPHVSDFGLAKQENAEVTLTLSGQILGTPAYMSPEQARGESQRLDRRSDIYSLGVVLYELLTGKRPFDGTSTLLLHQIQSEDPRAPRSLKNTIPRDLETICLKALSKSPDRRFATAQEMADDLRRFGRGETIQARRTSALEKTWKRVKRHRLFTAVTLLAIFSSLAAFDLALLRRPAEPAAPAGSVITVISPIDVGLETEPAGARVVLYPLDQETGEPKFDAVIRTEKVTPVTLKALPGDYLVVAVLDDGRFHEVYRQVPFHPAETPRPSLPHRAWENRNGVAFLTAIKIPPQDVTNGMALFEGSKDFEIGVPNSTTMPGHRRDVSAFYLDTHEVTFADFRRQNWTRYPDATMMRTDNPPEDSPVNGLFFEEAVRHAERVGKRLPTEWEFEFAGTMGGTQRFPWGNQMLPIDLWTPRRAGEPAEDRTPTTPPVFGLLSNAPEFVDSRSAPYPSAPIPSGAMKPTTPPDTLVIRGGALDDGFRADVLRDGVRARFADRRMLVSRVVGFRCARSVKPRWPE